MFALKILVGFLSVYCSYKLAKFKALKYKEVYYFWDSVCIACDLLISDLSYKKSAIKSVLNVDYPSETFAKLIGDYLLDNECNFPNFISAENTIKLNGFISSVGKSDSETQKKSILSYKNEFIKIKEESKIYFNKNYNLTVKIGVLIGIMLFILVI